MQSYIFLVEIGTEELPSKILKRLGKDFRDQIVCEFRNHEISYNTVNWYVSACHLAVKARITIQNKSDDKIVHIVNQYYDNKNNINDQLNISTRSVEYVKCDGNDEQHLKHKNLLVLLINNALKKMTNYEMMRWGKLDESFVRPVRSVTVLLDSVLIPGHFFGIDIDRILYGHRCVENSRIVIDHADDYPDVLLEKGRVIVDYIERKRCICAAVQEKAKELGGIVDVMKENILLEEVTALVEWPVVLYGKFDKKFLQFPDEIILHIMKCNQKYFPVYSAVNNSVLLPYFIFVANAVVDNYTRIITGHENVIKTRFMDVDFFLRNDSKNRLENYISKLDNVLFHRKLGTLRNKVRRIEELSGWIASFIGSDIQQTRRAGYLCKCDLMSEMVYEFPETQGIMGMYYALRDGESEQIALAQKEHYYPRFSKDILPTTLISCAVSIADKIDTISGIFGVKEFPRGKRDPFALKRCAFGILRILICKKLSLNLCLLIKESIKLYGTQLTNMTVVDDVYLYMYNRLRAWYLSQGYKSNVIQSVWNASYTTITIADFDIRIKAIASFCDLQREEIIQLKAVYRRVSNILSNKQVSCILSGNKIIQSVLLKSVEEINLFDQLIVVENRVKLLFDQCRYYEALVFMTTLCGLINNFFDHVIVMESEQNLRINRLVLLSKVRDLFGRVADFSLLCI